MAVERQRRAQLDSVARQSAAHADDQLAGGLGLLADPPPSSGITASFDIYLASSNSNTGADGLTFTLADASVTKPTALGDNGGGEGFSGITGIAVSFDTWKNTNDPSSNFVGIATTNSRQQQLNYMTTNSSVPYLRNTIHHVVVTTDTTGISVTMDGNQVLAYDTTLPPKVLVGFTAATGGSTTRSRSRMCRSAPVRPHRRRP